MEVTVKKSLNGIEIHAAYIDEMGNEQPMAVDARYNIEIPEVRFKDKRLISLLPYMSDQLKAKVEELVGKAQVVIDSLEI